MESEGKLYVIKRSGAKEKVQLDQITDRITELCKDLNQDFVDPVREHIVGSVTSLY